MTKVLVVDDKQIMRDSVGLTLQRAGYSVVTAGDAVAAINLVARHKPSAVITDLKMPEVDGLELLARLREADPQLPVVLMTAYGSIDVAVQAMKQGAFDFIQKPFEGDQLVSTLARAVKHRSLMEPAREPVNKAGSTGVHASGAASASSAAAASSPATPMLVGQSAVMRRLRATIQQFAQSHGTVLISGESGVGKEVIARTLHALSPRRDKVMLCLNCAALSATLLESELFGHEKGAFTGADQLRKGRFELCDSGTLLLDEISEISATLQAKLLRVLQEKQFERVGSSATLNVDVRVIATTNRDLSREVQRGEFRQDLYYRLNVLPIHVPPLRHRKEDIPELAEHFLQRVAQREGHEPRRMHPQAVEVLQRYDWPGNVRELQNICERASIITAGDVIEPEVLQSWLGHQDTVAGFGLTHGTGPVHAAPATVNTEAVHSWSSTPATLTSTLAGMMPHRPVAAEGGPVRLEDLEREQVVRTLSQFGGNRARTAAALGIGLRTLGLKLKKWKEQNLVAPTI